MRNKPLTPKQAETVKRIEARQDVNDDSKINFEDIPELTEEQFATAIRPNRAREFVGVRLDWDVLHWLKSYGPGHSTRINRILRAVMEKELAARNSMT